MRMQKMEGKEAGERTDCRGKAGTKTPRVWQRTEPSISLGKQTNKQTTSKVSKCNLYFLLTIIS